MASPNLQILEETHMRNVQNLTFSRLALVALLTASFAFPLAVTPASARGDGGGSAGGSTGGSAGGSTGGAGCGGCGAGAVADVVIVPPGRGPQPRKKFFVAAQHFRKSCYKATPIFDGYGNKLGDLHRQECYTE